MSSGSSYTPNSGGTTTTSDPTGGAFGSAGFTVWTGGDQQVYFHDSLNGGTVNVEGGNVDAGSYLHDQMQSLSRAQLTELQTKLVKAGYLPAGSVTGLPDINTITGYGKLLRDVSTANGLGQMLTPEQYLDRAVKNQAANPGNASTNVSSSVNITDPRTARDTAEQVFRAKLGHKPTAEQLDAFYSALASYEQANPSVTTSSQSGGQDSTSTSATTGGATDPATFAGQYVDSHFGTQVGTHDALHFYDLAVQALTSPQPGVQHAV